MMGKEALVEEINTLGLPQDGTDLKSSEQFDTKLIAKIDISKEWSNISDDILRNSIRLKYKISKKGKPKNMKLFLGKDRVHLRFSKNGYLYGVIATNNYLPAPFVARLFDILLTDTVIKHTVKGGMFEYIPLKYNDTILWLHYHIEKGKILYISNEEVVLNALGGISRKFLKKEYDTKPLTLVKTQSSSEIYGHNESGLGWLATNDLINRLEIVKEVLEEAKSYTHYEVKELLQEIKEMICED